VIPWIGVMMWGSGVANIRGRLEGWKVREASLPQLDRRTGSDVSGTSSRCLGRKAGTTCALKAEGMLRTIYMSMVSWLAPPKLKFWP
jgi:hypothetical protein